MGFASRAFQLPTGWNSTMLNALLALSAVCFNSQRDGILPAPFRAVSLKRVVSTPNGMEFYPGTSLNCLGVVSFNSQRDGILRCRWHRHSLYSSVSTPNGMEFYKRDGERNNK